MITSSYHPFYIHSAISSTRATVTTEKRIQALTMTGGPKFIRRLEHYYSRFSKNCTSFDEGGGSGTDDTNCPAVIDICGSRCERDYGMHRIASHHISCLSDLLKIFANDIRLFCS